MSKEIKEKLVVTSLHLTTAELHGLEKSGDDVVLKSYVDSGSLSLTAGIGGITIDSTVGGTGTGSQLGAVIIKAADASSWNVTGNDLTLQTVTSGNITMSSSGSFFIDADTASSITVDSNNLTISTTTTGSVDINSAGTTNVVSGNEIVLTATGALNLDGNGVLIDSSSGFSVDGVAASNVTVTGGNLTLSSVTSGNVIVSSAADVSVSADADISINGGTSAIVSTTTGNLTLQTLGTDNIALTSGANVNLNATSDIVMTSANCTLDATGGFSFDAASASNMTVDGGNLTVSTTTSGNLSLSSVGTASLSGTTVTVDGTTLTNLGTTTGAVNIGKTGLETTVLGEFVCDEIATFKDNVTIAGNLTVAGDRITTGDVYTTDNVMKLNEPAPRTGSVDGGVLFGRSGVNVVGASDGLVEPEGLALRTKDSTYIATLPSYNKVMIQSSDSFTVLGSWQRINNLAEVYGQVIETNNEYVLINRSPAPVSLTGTVSCSTTTLTGTGTAFTTELNPGDQIEVTDSGDITTLTIVSIASDTSAVVSTSQTIVAGATMKRTLTVFAPILLNDTQAVTVTTSSGVVTLNGISETLSYVTYVLPGSSILVTNGTDSYTYICEWVTSATTMTVRNPNSHADISSGNWSVYLISIGGSKYLHGPALTGTVQVTSSSALVGTGTNFDPEVTDGDTLIIDNREYVVTTRTDDNNLVLDGSNSNLQPAGSIAYIKTTVTVINDGGTMTANAPTGQADFTNQVVSGMTLVIAGEEYVVAGISSSTSITFDGNNTNTQNAGSTIYIQGAVYDVHNKSKAGIIWDESTDKMKVVYTTNHASSDLSIVSLADMEVGALTVSSITVPSLSISGTDAVTGASNWSTGELVAGTHANGALLLGGGLAAKNAIVTGDGSADAINDSIVVFEQTATDGDVSVLRLEQAHHAAPMLQFSGRSTYDGSGFSTATGTIVSAPGNTNITGATTQGYIMIRITDNSDESGAVTSGDYFLPFFSLVAA